MKFLTRSAFLVLALSGLFLWQCTTTKKSSTTKQQVTVQNVWFSDKSDMDGDGYNSYARLNFDINVSSGSKDVSVWLGVRETDPADTALYIPYFVFAAFAIEGSSDGDARYISIGDPNFELPWGRFDFLLQVFEGEGASDENADVIAQASISSHSVLEDVPFEESKTDAGLVIFDTYWEPATLVDNDNDGYYSESGLVVDVDVNQGDSADVFLLLYSKASSESEWNLLIPLDQTYTFTVSGTSSDDARMYGLSNFPHDTYDFAVEAYINDGLFQVEDMQDPSNNSLLNDWPLETADEDVGQVLEIYDAYWTDQVDNDTDGYYSQANLVVDVDVNAGSADVYLKIYAKSTSSGIYNLIHTTGTFSITEYSSADAYAVAISNFSHGSYDFKVEVYFAGDNTVRDEIDKDSDSDLGAVNLETAAEDQSAATTWISYHDNSFEDYVYYVSGDFSSATVFVVGFDHPVSAVTCTIKKIAINIYQDPSYGKLRVINSGNIYAPPNLVALNTGWNTFDVDVDVTDHDPFFVGYLQAQQDNPKLSVDKTAPHSGRSWWWNGSEWVSETDMDYAIEVFVEYTVGVGKSKTETIATWLPGKLTSGSNIDNVIKYGVK